MSNSNITQELLDLADKNPDEVLGIALEDKDLSRTTEGQLIIYLLNRISIQRSVIKYLEASVFKGGSPE